MTRVGNFRRGDEAGQSAADHDYVRIIGHRVVPPLLRLIRPKCERFGDKLIAVWIEARGVNRGQRQMVLLCALSVPWRRRNNLRLFQFGTLSAAKCSRQATPNLNLF